MTDCISQKWWAAEASTNRKSVEKIDEIDFKILDCMVAGYSNRAIANRVKKPLSTVQRRTRKLFKSGLIKRTYELNYRKFGYKIGLLHIYLDDGNAQELAEKIRSSIDDILSVSIHIGNSDIVAEYACKDTINLMDLMAKVKKLPGIRNIVWSEEVYAAKAAAPVNKLQSSY